MDNIVLFGFEMPKDEAFLAFFTFILGILLTLNTLGVWFFNFIQKLSWHFRSVEYLDLRLKHYNSKNNNVIFDARTLNDILEDFDKVEYLNGLILKKENV